MGTIIHHAAIVTGSTDWETGEASSAMLLARDAAVRLFDMQVSGFAPSPINGYTSFLVASVGSKLGWVPQHEHEVKLRQFREALDGLSVDVVFVRYGETEPTASLTP